MQLTALVKLEKNWRDQHARLIEVRGKPELTLGPMCSGLGLAVPVFMQFYSRLSAMFNLEMAIVHLFSVEFHKKKREWLPSNSCPVYLFGSVTDIAKDEAWDYNSSMMVSVSAVDIFIGSLACRCFSYLTNTAGSMWAHCGPSSALEACMCDH